MRYSRTEYAAQDRSPGGNRPRTAMAGTGPGPPPPAGSRHNRQRESIPGKEGDPEGSPELRIVPVDRSERFGRHRQVTAARRT